MVASWLVARLPGGEVTVILPNTKVFLRSNDMWEKHTLAGPVGLQMKIGGNCTFFFRDE